MKRLVETVGLIALLGTASAFVVPGDHLSALAQPAKGAAAAFERVLEVMNNRFKDVKLGGDPDRDFATLVLAHHEDLIFLARTQLEHGGDAQLRRLAEKIVEDQQKQISELKEWQVRSRQANYKAQPDQPPPGSGPLDTKGAQAAQAAPAAPATSAPASVAAANLPTVAGTVEKVDTAGGRITIDHGPIPNLNMDPMTMVFRAQDPALLSAVKPGDKIRFQADRVNGQIAVVNIHGGRSAPASTPTATAATNLPAVSGTVEKVDLAQGKITIDHGPIPNLNMDAMTMVFRVQDPSLLRSVKAGDRVRFQADRVNGQISLVTIQKGR